MTQPRLLRLGTDGWPRPEETKPFDVDGVHYPTLVHWLEADRARFLADQDALDAILEAPTAEEALAAGTSADAPGWIEVDALTWGVLHLCHAHEALGAWLHRTGDDPLVVVDDARWGVGAAQDPTDRSTWKGPNGLGEALQGARAARRAKLVDHQAAYGHDIITRPRRVGPVVGSTAPAEASLKHMLFGFGGGLRPRDFLIGHAFAVTLGAFPYLTATTRFPPFVATALAVPIALVSAWMLFALYSKRLQSTAAGILLGSAHMFLIVGSLFLHGGASQLLAWTAVAMVLATCLVPERPEAPAR